MSVVERLRILLAEKFNQKPEEIELDLHPGPTKEWIMIVDPHPYIFRVFITAYKNGKIEIDTGPERTRSEISNFYLWEKYKQKYEKAMTEEEKRRLSKRRMRRKTGSLKTSSRRSSRITLRLKGLSHTLLRDTCGATK